MNGFSSEVILAYLNGPNVMTCVLIGREAGESEERRKYEGRGKGGERK
jgi:hypothetical protein